MTSLISPATLAAMFLAAPLAAQAGYVLEPVLVDGQPALTVTTINAYGAVGGTFRGDKGFRKGFVLTGPKVTVIEKPHPNDFDYYTPSPNSILRDGMVTGTIDGGDIVYGFVWRLGQYRQDFNASGIGSFIGNFVKSNDSGTLIFNDYYGDGVYQAFTGKVEPFTQLIPPCGIPLVTSINRTGTVSGTCFAFPNPAIFLYQAGAYTLVTMPEATAITGGFINDAGDLAGAYKSGTSPVRAFIKRGDRFITFGPATSPTSLAVAAFSNTRFVAGTYTDSTGALHAFAYHHGQFSELAPVSTTYNGIQVTGVSDAGDVALNILDSTTGTFAPYIARCYGNVC